MAIDVTAVQFTQAMRDGKDPLPDGIEMWDLHGIRIFMVKVGDGLYDSVKVGDWITRSNGFYTIRNKRGENYGKHERVRWFQRRAE